MHFVVKLKMLIFYVEYELRASWYINAYRGMGGMYISVIIGYRRALPRLIWFSKFSCDLSGKSF